VERGGKTLLMEASRWKESIDMLMGRKVRREIDR